MMLLSQLGLGWTGQQLHYALRSVSVPGIRLIETISQPHVQPRPTQTPLPHVASSRLPDGQPSSSQQPDTSKFLDVMSSLWQQQHPLAAQQGSQQLQQAAQLPQHTAIQSGRMAMQWPKSASQQPTNPSCQPDLSAASSGQVRMESQLVFDSCWRRFKEKHGMEFAAPREIVWLNGAPGSGKGVGAPHIQKVRGMTKSICVSSLLSKAPETQHFIAAGEMINDATVGDLLLQELLQPTTAGLDTADLNTVVDGFPRTAVQVDFVKLLLDKLMRLHRKYVDTPLAAQFPRPAFKVVVLYVDEATSIQRQLQRAVAARAHNARLNDAGVGEQARLLEERPTDLDRDKAAKRYMIFKQHYSSILRLKQFLPFHLIDAMGSKQNTQEQITQELRYQSSLDLSEEAYNTIRHLPLAKDLQQTARQQLVGRLEQYCQQQRPLFGRVLDILQSQVLPLLQQGALAGSAEWVSQEPLFSQQPVCVDMLLDVLCDRGFKAAYCKEDVMIPASIDPQTGNVTVRRLAQHRFRFVFEQAQTPEASILKVLEIAAREQLSSFMAAATQGRAAASLAGEQHSQLGSPGDTLAGVHPAAIITESFIPEHLDHEAKAKRAKDLRRITLTALNRKAACATPQGAASPVDGCAAAACGGAGCSSCSASSDEGEVVTIHRCMRPDLKCGNVEELEVFAANA